MDFEQLQQSWRSQPIDAAADIAGIKNKVENQWAKQQRSIMRSNTFTTIAFAAVLVNFGWVYSSFHKGHTIFFGGSLLFMTLLMLVYVWVLWKGYILKKNDPSVSSDVYLSAYLDKLYWRRKTITTFTWIYSVLLWLAFMFYCFDVTTGGSPAWRILPPVIISVYIFGMNWILSKTTKKKQLKKLDELIGDIRQLKDKMRA